jgi:nucleoside-diphosphate-sugar epimerase
VLAVSAPGASGAYNLVDDALTQAEWLRQGDRALRPVYIPPRLAVVLAFGLEMTARALRRQVPAFSRYRIRRATEQLRYDIGRAQRDLGWTPVVGVRARPAPAQPTVGEPALAAPAALEPETP